MTNIIQFPGAPSPDPSPRPIGSSTRQSAVVVPFPRRNQGYAVSGFHAALASRMAGMAQAPLYDDIAALTEGDPDWEGDAASREAFDGWRAIAPESGR